MFFTLFSGPDVRPSLVRPWWPRRLGHLSSRSRLHFRTGSFNFRPFSNVPEQSQSLWRKSVLVQAQTITNRSSALGQRGWEQKIYYFALTMHFLGNLMIDPPTLLESQKGKKKESPAPGRIRTYDPSVFIPAVGHSLACYNLWPERVHS